MKYVGMLHAASLRYVVSFFIASVWNSSEILNRAGVRDRHGREKVLRIQRQSDDRNGVLAIRSF